MARYRIRRCDGNRAAWLLCLLKADGTEYDTNGCYTTAMSLDRLLEEAKHLTPLRTDSVELIYTKGDA